MSTAFLCNRDRTRTGWYAVPRFRVPFQPLQVGPHIRRYLIAQLSILLQRLADDTFQFGWHFGIQPHHRRGFRVQNGFEDDRRTLPTEGQHPCCHLVKHSAKGEQIAPRIQFLCPRLLRRHIRDRAER